MEKQLKRWGTMCLVMLAAIVARAEIVTAQWDFQNAVPSTITEVNIQGAAGTVASDVDGIVLTVDATNGSGKLQYNSSGYAQFNNGTIIKVPVISANDVVTVVSYPGQAKYTVGGEDATGQNTFTHTATKDEAQQGSVEIVATATAYLYAIKVEQDKDAAADVVADVNATWDYSNSTVMEETLALSGSTGSGTVRAIEDNGVLLTIEPNGATFRNNGNNIQMREGTVLKVPVKSTDDVVTVKGYPNYSYFTIGTSDELNGEQVYKAKQADVAQGYVQITSTNNNNYFYSISVLQKAQEPPVVLEHESVTATFPFELGTEGQVADFGDATDYFLNSKVTHGDGLTLLDRNNKVGFYMTRFQPTEKVNSANEDNTIRFLIQPKPGFAFTPSSVSLKATRFGTNDGKLDFAWQNADGTTVSLATEEKPNRENGAQGDPYSVFEFDIENATPGEGACGLVINLYGLANNKQIGFADIVIAGELNGEEVAMPILGSFVANGVEYAADDVFEADGDKYVGSIELSKTETMIGENNPLTEVTPTSGEIGNITYAGDATQCVVTIPMTAGTASISYVLTVVQKPDFTLTYYNTDGSQMGTQTVEKDATIAQFAVDFNTATAQEGNKVRGWFVKPTGGQKFTTSDVITADTDLYAVETEIEEPSDFRKYTFALTDPYFYAEDHEAFNPTGKGAWHDTTHGWVFSNGDSFDVLVGKKATVSVSVCRYSNTAAKLTVKDANGNELETLDGYSETDGDVVVYNHEGEEGTLTFDISASGSVYIHNVKIVNTTTTNYTANGQWIEVKAGDASSLVDALDAANGQNASKSAERTYIYLPNGTYDLGNKTLTQISGHNISLIGESMEGVVIKNKPETEGIGVTATLYNTGTNNYLQDITLKNEWDYYGINGDGRAVCWWDKGSNTTAKNVTLLSYQDTYYTNNADGQYYWDTSDIHGTVDFICGEGTLFVENSTLTVEKRNADGSGSCTLTAPSTKAGNAHGYVFSNCKIDNYAASYNLGRAWNNEPRCAYINTTVNDNKIVADRWTAKGMNVVAKEFVEYNTIDENGNVVSPASKVVDFYYGSNQNSAETILTAAEAANFAYEKVFTGWDPKALVVQAAAPANAKLSGTTLTWDAVEGATMYLIEKDGEFVALSAETTCETDGSEGEYTVRAANAMGGFGEAAVADEAAEGNVITITSYGYATFFTEDEFTMPEGVTGYTVLAGGRELTYGETFEAGATVPAATALLLKGDQGDYEYEVTATGAAAVEENLLKASDGTAVEDSGSKLYVLSTRNNVVGFYYQLGHADGHSVEIPAGKCYLQIPAAQAAEFYVFDGDVNAIDSLQGDTLTNAGAIYNMAGQRVNANYRGMVIKNGKKYLNK